MLEICLEVAPCSCFCSGGKHNLFLKIYSILNDQIDDASLGAYVLAIELLGSTTPGDSKVLACIIATFIVSVTLSFRLRRYK
jgi:hypothetical protein